MVDAVKIGNRFDRRRRRDGEREDDGIDLIMQNLQEQRVVLIVWMVL